VTQVAGPDAPRLSAVLTGRQIDQPAEELVRRTLDRLVGLSVDLSQFAAMAAPDPLLGPLAARMRGLKPPRFATVFEALIKTLDLAWELLAAFPADELKRLTPELVQRYGRLHRTRERDYGGGPATCAPRSPVASRQHPAGSRDSSCLASIPW
jgi:hypothetical protein